MKCPFCGFQESKVIDSRHSDDGSSIRRRRECLSCQKRFTTYETVESLQADLGSNISIKLKTYVDMQDNVCGHEISASVYGFQVMAPISWITAVDGDTTYTEANLGEIQILGESTESGSNSKGYYELYVSGSKMAKLEGESDGLVTTVRFLPGEGLLSNLLHHLGQAVGIVARVAHRQRRIV